MRIDRTAVSQRYFFGLGAQADGYLYDRANARLGVKPEDFALNERRLQALRLANTRMFFCAEWINPSLDGRKFRWKHPDLKCFMDQLRRHRDNGTLCNLVLFQPTHPNRGQIAACARAAVAMVEHLKRREGLDNIRWLTLWNEPDSLFPHRSPLMRRVFGPRHLKERLPWRCYVQANRLAYRLLEEKGLAPAVQLAVADCVWGARVRHERMRLALEEFGDLDVAYAYHNYNPEDRAFYRGNPDFAYEGMAPEARKFRRWLGQRRSLLLTEFNIAGHGFGTFFLGAGRGGSELVGSIAGASLVAWKVLEAAAAGVDGFTLWCLHDMAFCQSIQTAGMACGLWRFKWHNWVPRPIYHYYGELIRALRPGSVLYRVSGCPKGASAIFCRQGEEERLLIVNNTAEKMAIEFEWPRREPGKPIRSTALIRRRVYEEILPAVCDLPQARQERISAAALARPFVLEPWELSVWERRAEHEREK
ncbi:MAG: hypothetical protein N3A66_03950 [Planctomycetota bacterium]|nr:hypothetical protein [Planctomycetota bacterium]